MSFALIIRMFLSFIGLDALECVVVQVGRTARAGKEGRVTSLVSEESKPLADAIR